MSGYVTLDSFGVLNSTGDANFDRIAHLAKLVFNVKCVAISLVDDQDVCVTI